jgi:hypothetical protein
MGDGEQRIWHGQTERLGGLEIDDQLDLRYLLDRRRSRAEVRRSAPVERDLSCSPDGP